MTYSRARRRSGRTASYLSTPVTTTPRMNAFWARKKMTTGTAIASTRGRLDQRRLARVQRVVLLDPDRQRLQLGLVREVQQRHEEVVPGQEEVEQGHGGDRRDRLRDDDAAQDPERAGAVDHRGLVHLAWDRHEVLAQQEHVERVGEEVGDDERQPRPVPAEPREDHVLRQQRDLVRQDDRPEQDEEEEVPPGNRNRAKPYATRIDEKTAPIVLSSAIPTVLREQPREVQLVPDGRVVLDERREPPRLLERPPAPLPLDLRRARVRRVDEHAGLAARLDEHQVARPPSIGTV